MGTVEKKKKIYGKIRDLRQEIISLEKELKKLNKADHRTPMCKHGIDTVCYACSYP